MPLAEFLLEAPDRPEEIRISDYNASAKATTSLLETGVGSWSAESERLNEQTASLSKLASCSARGSPRSRAAARLQPRRSPCADEGGLASDPVSPKKADRQGASGARRKDRRRAARAILASWERSTLSGRARMASTPFSTKRSKRATRSRPAPTPMRSSRVDRQGSNVSRVAQTRDGTSSRWMTTESPRCDPPSRDAPDGTAAPGRDRHSGPAEVHREAEKGGQGWRARTRTRRRAWRRSPLRSR
jgi:hypothetical protein